MMIQYITKRNEHHAGHKEMFWSQESCNGLVTTVWKQKDVGQCPSGFEGMIMF